MNRYHSGPVSCHKCGHAWPNMLLDGMPVVCPDCGTCVEVRLDFAPAPFSVHHDHGKIFALTDLSSRPGYSSSECDVANEYWEAEDLRTGAGGMALAGRLLCGFIGAVLMLEEMLRFGGISIVQLVAVASISIAVAWPRLARAASFLYGAIVQYQIGTVVCELCGYNWQHVVLDGHPKLCPNCGRYTLKPLVPRQITPVDQQERDQPDSPGQAYPQVVANPTEPVPASRPAVQMPTRTNPQRRRRRKHS